MKWENLKSQRSGGGAAVSNIYRAWKSLYLDAQLIKLMKLRGEGRQVLLIVNSSQKQHCEAVPHTVTVSY